MSRQEDRGPADKPRYQYDLITSNSPEVRRDRLAQLEADGWEIAVAVDEPPSRYRVLVRRPAPKVTVLPSFGAYVTVGADEVGRRAEPVRVDGADGLVISDGMVRLRSGAAPARYTTGDGDEVEAAFPVGDVEAVDWFGEDFRAGTDWTERDDRLLRGDFEAGLPDWKIAARMGRTAKAVDERRKILKRKQQRWWPRG